MTFWAENSTGYLKHICQKQRVDWELQDQQESLRAPGPSDLWGLGLWLPGPAATTQRQAGPRTALVSLECGRSRRGRSSVVLELHRPGPWPLATCRYLYLNGLKLNWVYHLVPPLERDSGHGCHEKGRSARKEVGSHCGEVCRPRSGAVLWPRPGVLRLNSVPALSMLRQHRIPQDCLPSQMPATIPGRHLCF